MPREMKDSGIEWIGEMPSLWNCIKMKYYVSISSGTSIEKEEYVENGEYPIIGSNGEIGKVNKTNNDNWVITTGRVGTVGTTHIVKDAWITDNALAIHTLNISQQYLAYVIPNFDFNYMLSGTAQPLITATKLKNQFVPIPPLSEQKAIADFLDRKCAEIDAVIEQTKTTIEEYKKLKQSIITEAVTKGIRGDRPMKDSGIEWIGEIPREWEVSRIKHSIRWKSVKGHPNATVLSLYRDYGVIPKDSRDDNHNVTSLDTSSYKVILSATK